MIKHTLKKISTLLVILSLLILGCSKKDFISPSQQLQNEALAVKKFLTAPDNASPALKSLIADWAKSELQYHFTAGFISKNGMPVWDKTESNLAIANSATLQNSNVATFGSSASNNKGKGIFFIPFIDSVSKEVTAYMLCSKTGDSTYTYQYFNKKDIMGYPLKNAQQLDNGYKLLGIMAAFENKLNNRPAIHYAAPYNCTYKNASFGFGNFVGSNISTKHVTNNKPNTNDVSVFDEPDCVETIMQTHVFDGVIKDFIYNTCTGFRWQPRGSSGADGTAEKTEVIKDGGGGGLGAVVPNPYVPPPFPLEPQPYFPPGTQTNPAGGYANGDAPPTGGNGGVPNTPPNVNPGSPASPFWNFEEDATFNPQDPGENFEFEFYSDPAVDLEKLFKCFDNVPDAGAAYTVKLCADLPDNNEPLAIATYSGNPGHSFITMTKTNGNVSVTQSFGFYPRNGPLSIAMLAVSSKVVDNGGHEYNASVTMNNISLLDFQTIQNTAKSLGNSMLYDINDFNCTTYALDVFNSIRPGNHISVANATPGFDYGKTPGGLYQLLKNSNPVSNNIEVGTFSAPAKIGPCN